MPKKQETRNKKSLTSKDFFLFDTVFKKALNKIIAISAADSDGNIFFANNKFCKLTGYSKKELIGKNHRIIKSGYHPRKFYEGMWNTITKGKIWEGEMQYRDKNGFFHWKDVIIVPVPNHKKGFIYVSLQTEVTQYKNLAKNREEFVDAAAHEIRSPLSVIKTASENVLSGLYGPVPGPITKIVGAILQNINQGIRTVNNILSFPQLEDKEELINSHQINTVAFFSDLAVRFQPIAQEHALLIIPDIASNLPPICVNEDLITQVVSNLLSNSFRFAKEKIVFKTQYRKGLIYTAIIDDGPGITGEDRKKLFTKFSRIGKRVQKGGYKSTGLGLAICKEIIEEVHKGKIWAESKKGKGTAFIFSLDTQCRCQSKNS